MLPTILQDFATLCEASDGYMLELHPSLAALYARASRACETCGREHGETSADGLRTLNKPEDEPLCSDCWNATGDN